MPWGPRSQTYCVRISRKIRENGRDYLTMKLIMSVGSASVWMVAKQLLALFLWLWLHQASHPDSLSLAEKSLCSNIPSKMSEVHFNQMNLDLVTKSLPLQTNLQAIDGPKPIIITNGGINLTQTHPPGKFRTRVGREMEKWTLRRHSDTITHDYFPYQKVSYQRGGIYA